MSKKKSYKPSTAGSAQGDIFGKLTAQNQGSGQPFLPQSSSNSLVSGDRPLTRNPGGKKTYLPNSGISQDAQDIIAMQNNMMMPSRGFKRAGGDKPDLLGGGMNEFYANNPHIARGPERAAQLAQERQQQLSQGFANGRAAVQEKLAEQQMQQQMLQDNAGQNRSVDRGYGSGSVEFLPPGQRTRGTMKDPLTGNSVYMDEYLPQQSQVQDTKYGAMPGQENGGALTRPRVQSQPPQTQPPNLSGIDQIFPQQSSPSGGGASSLVGAGVAQGAPGGDFSMPQWVNDALIPSALPYQPQIPQTIEQQSSPGVFDMTRGSRDQLPPNSGPQPAPYVPKQYDYIFPGMQFPQTGTYGQRELARRGSQAVIPGAFDKIESGAQGMQNSISDFLRYLFGDPNPPEITQQYR